MIHVRERPRLAHTVEAETPTGRFYRWAADDPRAENVPSGIGHSSTMPGGFERMDCVLPRQPGRDYPDLARLSSLRVRDAGGGIVWEGRLERAPRTSGDRISVSPSAVGWQAHLDDDKSAQEIYVDREINAWQEATIARKAAYGSNVDAQITTQIGTEVAHFFAQDAIPQFSVSEIRYVAPASVRVSLIVYQGVNTNVHAGVEAATVFTPSGGSAALTLDDTLRFVAVTPDTQLWLRAFWSGATGTPLAGSVRRYKKLAVYGDHGATARARPGDTDGYFASDIVAHAVQTWAPLLSFTYAEDSSGTIQRTSGFVIPHSAFKEPTTAGAMVRDATRYGLHDWAVWEGPTFYLHARGARGRNWRARIGPAQLEETGPQVERLWNSVLVQYRDVDGTTRTVGPPGSGADTTSTSLEDTDPENPANRLGIKRRDLLQMGTGTAGSATELGSRFLEQSKLLDSSGRARLVGHVEDDRGVLHPYSHVRAGDTITFVDASDTTARRIVKADHDHDQRACTVDLDAPPEGLQALLERLGVVLVPLGL